MPYYGQNPNTWGGNGQTMYPQSTVPMGRSYNTGYPQGNLGQMNGYSQANAGYPQAGMQGGYQQGYPQGMESDLCFVMGIEGAKNLMGTPNTRKAAFDEDKPLMYIVSFGPQGSVNDIHVYQFEECSEEMPQHLSPLMKQNMMPMGGGLGQQGDYVTRAEFDELKEMLSNAQSSSSTDANASRANGSTQSANAGRTR